VGECDRGVALCIPNSHRSRVYKAFNRQAFAGVTETETCGYRLVLTLN